VVTDSQRGTHDGRLDLYDARRLKPCRKTESINLHSEWIMTSPDVRVMVTHDGQWNHLQPYEID